MEIFNSRRITNIGVVASIYVVLTVALGGLAYGSIQFRVSEVLVLLCMFNKDYIISMTLGCFIANLFSTVGVVDTIVGTSATLISVVLIYLCRDKLGMIICSLFPVIFNGVFVAAELVIMGLNDGAPFFLIMGQVAFGEFVCVTIIGTVLVKSLSRNSHFMKLITAGIRENANK